MIDILASLAVLSAIVILVWMLLNYISYKIIAQMESKAEEFMKTDERVLETPTKPVDPTAEAIKDLAAEVRELKEILKKWYDSQYPDEPLEDWMEKVNNRAIVDAQ